MEMLSITLIVYLIVTLISEVASNGAGGPLVSSMERFSCIRPSIWPHRHHVAKTPGDNGFRIRVAGRPEPGHFKAGDVYTVSLESTMSGMDMSGFLLVAVPQWAKDETTQLGHFQLLDSEVTRFSPTCPHIITHQIHSGQSSTFPRRRVDVLWTAPPTGTGCIEFRATVFYGSSGQWLQDDGALSKLFCETKIINHGL